MSERISGESRARPQPQIVSPPGRRSSVSRGFWTDAWRRLVRNPLAMASLSFLSFLALAAVVAPVFLPYSHEKQDLLALYASPSAAHWLGTDHLGRDLLSRLLIGARISLTVGLVAECIIISIGTPLGLVAGYSGGWVDSLIMRVVDALYAFPDLLLIIIVMSYLKAQLGTDDLRGGAGRPVLPSCDPGSRDRREPDAAGVQLSRRWPSRRARPVAQASLA